MIKDDKDDKGDQGDSDHYFSAQPRTASAPKQVVAEVRGLTLRLWTDRGVFSYGELDRGTKFLARAMRLPERGEVLDWGAGYGVLGIVAALLCPECQVTLVEVNERAAALARQNVELAGLTNATVVTGEAPEVLGDREFDVIVSNPPLHVGKAAVETVIREARRRLRPGGSLWLVVPTKKGARGFLSLMEELFEEAATIDVSGGFRVLRGSRGVGASGPSH